MGEGGAVQGIQDALQLPSYGLRQQVRRMKTRRRRRRRRSELIQLTSDARLQGKDSNDIMLTWYLSR